MVGEIFIAAPPERVFQAITDPKQAPLWWGQKGMYRITEWKGDVRPGGKWSSAGIGDDGTKFRVDGEYLEVDFFFFFFVRTYLAHEYVLLGSDRSTLRACHGDT